MRRNVMKREGIGSRASKVGGLLLLAVFALGGCESDDPPITPLDGGTVDGGGQDGGDVDAGPVDAGDSDAGDVDAGVPACARQPNDYFPDVAARDVVAWPACISDDGAYHPFSTGPIAGVTRADQYRQIIALLFDATRDPTVADFIAARSLYVNTADPNAGIAIRIGRRADLHYESTVPAATDCTAVGIATTYPDYCAGPAKLEPLINAAFTAGSSAGTANTRIEAAKIEAGLLWFMYLSPISEVRGCTTNTANCDSAYAYYTGGAAPRDGIGLGAYIQAADPLAHDRAWDAVLGVRCWRDLDSAVPATDLALRDRVSAQLDRATLDGVAAVVRARALRVAATTGSERDAHWAFVRTMAGFLDRAMRLADAPVADALATEAAKTDASLVDVAAITDALDAVFVCP
jgi:hypothetical protein